MRCSVARGAALLATLMTMPTEAGKPTGENASKLTEEELLRLSSRVRRVDNRGQPMPLGDIVARSARRARSRNTRGKK